MKLWSVAVAVLLFVIAVFFASAATSNAAGRFELYPNPGPR